MKKNTHSNWHAYANLTRCAPPMWNASKWQYQNIGERWLFVVNSHNVGWFIVNISENGSKVERAASTAYATKTASFHRRVYLKTMTFNKLKEWQKGWKFYVIFFLYKVFLNFIFFLFYQYTSVCVCTKKFFIMFGWHYTSNKLNGLVWMDCVV